MLSEGTAYHKAREHCVVAVIGAINSSVVGHDIWQLPALAAKSVQLLSLV